MGDLELARARAKAKLKLRKAQELEKNTETSPEPTTLDEIESTVSGGAIGATAGLATQKVAEKVGSGAKKLGMKALESIGPTDAPGLETLKGLDDEGLTRFEEIKANKGGGVADTHIKNIESIKKEGYQAAKRVGDVMEDLGVKVTPEELGREIESRAGIKALTPDEEKLAAFEAKKKELSELKAKAKIKKKELMKVSKDKREVSKKYNKFDQKVTKKIRKAEDELKRLKNKMNKKKKLSEAARKEKYNVDKLDLGKDRDLLAKDYEALEYKGAGGSADAVREIQKEKLDIKGDKLDLKEQKLDMKMDLEDKYEELRKLDEGKIKYREKRIQDLKREKADLSKVKKFDENIKLDDLKYDTQLELADIEDKIKAATSDLEKNKIIQSSLDADTRKALDRVMEVANQKGTIGGADLDYIMKSLNREYDKAGNKEVQRALRSFVLDKVDELSAMVDDNTVKQLLSDSARSIRSQSNLETLIPTTEIEDLSRSSGTKQIADLSTPRKLAAQMTPLKGAEGPREALIEVLEHYQKQGVIDQNTIRDLELNRIVQGLSKTEAAELVKQVTEASQTQVGKAGAIRSVLGALQEKTAISMRPKGLLGRLGKGMKTFGKAIPVIGGVIGAGMGYAEAKEAGMSDEEAMGIAAGEIINPLPHVSLTKATTQIRKAKELDRKDPVKVQDIDHDGFKEYLQQTPNVAMQSYVRRLDEAKERSENQSDYERRMSILVQEPAFRELYRRFRSKKLGVDNEQSDRDED